MTSPSSIKRSYHWFIIESEHSNFGIGDLLDGVLRDATGAAIYEIVPVNAEAQAATIPPVIPPPAPAPLWRGASIMALTIRDDTGAAVGTLVNGAAVDVWAGPLDIGGYTDRLVISAPGQPRRNVWAEGVKRA